MSLFRSEAVQARRSKYYGEILLTAPLGAGALTAVSVAFALLFLGILSFGSYTQKQRVSGRLVPDTGMVSAFAPQNGTIVSLHVREGQHVQAGDLLYVIKTSQIIGSGENAGESIRLGLIDQKTNLEVESVRQEELNRERVRGAKRRRESTRSELGEIDKNLSVIEKQRTLLEGSLEHYEELAAKELFPRLKVDEKRLELFQLESARRTLEREKIVIEKQAQLASEEVVTESLAGQNQSALIERNRQNAERALLEHEARSELRVLAPVSGKISVVLAKPGQVTTPRPLLSILPEGEKLQAEIYVPTHAISFVHKQSAVLLRYLAFPYQKFGQHRAVVESISASSMPLDWLDAPGGAPNAPNAPGTPVYRVVALLERETLTAYGVDRPLQPGMEFEADILLDQRRLYEWLLEPLFSVSGKL